MEAFCDSKELGEFTASCGGTVVLAMDGDANVASPYYPEPYPQEVDCEWMIYGPSGHFINATYG
jgi:hypothetical protein